MTSAERAGKVIRWCQLAQLSEDRAATTRTFLTLWKGAQPITIDRANV